MTGLLLLPVKQEMGVFYRKRISRVLWPFLIWSVLYCLYPVVVMGLGGTQELVLRCFPSAGEPSAALSGALLNIVRIPFDFSGYSVHMWYVFLIIGLYLYLPIFSAWVEKATMRQKHLVLGIWAVTLFLPYVEQGTEQLFGTCSWNSFGMLYYFAGFSGYMLLGHLVSQWKMQSLGRTLVVALPLWVPGYVGTFIGYRLIQTGAISSASSVSEMVGMALNPACPGLSYEPSHELCLLYCSPNVALMVVALLLIFRHFNAAPLRVRALLANMTACGFGIYLVHYLFVGPANILMTALQVPLEMVIPVAALLAFFVTWLVVSLLRRLLPRAWGRCLLG